MGASQSTKKKNRQAYVSQGAQEGHGPSSNSCPPTASSADTVSQPKQTLIGLKERLTSKRQTIREVQRLRESQTIMESQTMRVGQPSTVTPSDAQGEKAQVNVKQNTETAQVPTCSVPEPTEPTHSPVSDLTVLKQKTNTDFFYKTRREIFTALLAENGSSTPFAYAKKITRISESYAVLTNRPWYLIPMLHPIAVPSQMLVTGEKLVDEVEKLREKFSSRNKDSLDDVLSHLLKRSISCELCSTTIFNSRSEFLAHILSRQHHEELWENRSGVTKHDIDYWNYVLDLARPSEGPNKEHAKVLLNGRLRDEDGKLLCRQNVTNVPVLGTGKEDAVEKSVLNEAQTVRREGPKDCIQKPTSTVQPALTWSYFTSMANENPKKKVTKNNAMIQSELLRIRLEAWKSNAKPTSAVQPVQTWSSVVANGNPQKTPTITFTQQKQNVPSTKSTQATKNVVLTNSQRKKIRLQEAAKRNAEAKLDFFICPLCNVQLQHGRPFVEHTMGIRHIEKLYSKNGAITQQDVEFWNETIQQELHRINDSR